MLKLLLGRAATGKSTALLRRIAQESTRRPQLLIVPEQHSHDSERRLCAVAGNGVSLRAEVLSFTRLANRVFSVCGGLAEPVLDAGGRLLLMEVALKSVADRLKVYARPSRRPQFLSQLAATVDECKGAAISPAQLLEVAQSVEGEQGDKLWDISLICGAYDAYCAQRGADPRDKLTRLAQALTTCGWFQGRDVYLDSFTDFTAQERQVLEQILKQADSVTVALTCDSLEGGQEDVFSPARRTAHKLLSLARQLGVPVEVETRMEPSVQAAKGIAQIEKHLFSARETSLSGCPQGVELYRALSPYAEVERAAAELSRLVREEGYRYRELAITARSMEIYGPLISLIFPRYGLPVFLAQMDDVLQKPVLTLVTAALDTVAWDYRYEDLFRYLKTGLTGLELDQVDQLENYAIKWELRGGAWTQSKPWDKHPEGYGLSWTPEDKERVARLDDLRRQVIQPLEELRRVGEKTGEGLALALYGFLEKIQLAQRLTRRAQELRESGEEALAAEYQQLWQILCAALEQCAGLLGPLPMEWEEFARLFKLVLSQYQVGAIPVSLDQVTAGEMPRLAHKHCKVLYLLGADDTAIPAAAPSPGLLGDEERTLLASFGLETAPRLTDKLWREMTIVYESCALPSDKLVISYPAVGTAGEERRPSFLVKKLRALFPDLPLLDERTLGESFRLAAPRPALELAGRRPWVGRVLKEVEGYAVLVERMERAASLERGSLTRPAVEALYGKRVPMSASRMDKYRSCHFSYFMQYGLKAKARKSAGFQAPEYGTFVHYVLEQILKERKDASIPTREQVSAVVKRYVDEELGGLEGETPRFRYLFRRLEKAVYAVVENVCEELSRSDFEPIAFELGFGGKEGALPPVELEVDGVTVSVSGFVDRVDGWEKDGKLYLRVVDYKTGRKSFDFTDVWNGLGLQMLLYLFTLKEEGKALFGKEILPAGVLYLPARDAVVAGSRSMTEEERRKAVDKQLRRSGLILGEEDVLTAMEHAEGAPRFLPVKVNRAGLMTGEDLVTAERLGKLERHTRRILEQIAKELAAGNIAADPFWQPQRNACQWCDYAAACQFREGTGGDKKRWLAKMTAEEFWEKLD